LMEMAAQETNKVDLQAPLPPTRLFASPATRARAITPPKLLSRPQTFETPPAPVRNLREPEEPVKEDTRQVATLPAAAGSTEAGWNVGDKSSEAEGTVPGAGGPFDRSDVSVLADQGLEGGGGTGTAGLGRGTKGEGIGGAGLDGEAMASSARPLGGYQVKPRYPDSARRAGAQGTTLLKLLVLENGRVGEVLVERSAGHRDLDNAAAHAVKKWLFDPARRGKEPVAVWVLLPVKFELN
jgi:TonB family protein